MQDRARLWLFVLRWRDLFLIAVILVAVLTPQAGAQRFTVAAVLALVVLPYNGWLRHRTRRTGRVPVLMAFGDPLLCAAIALQFPDLLAAAMVAAEMDLAIAAATFRRRVALQSAALGAAAFIAVGVIDKLRDTEIDGAALAVPAYCVAAVTTALMISTLVQRERATSRQLATVVDGLRVVAFETDARTHRVRWVSPNVEEVTGLSESHWRAGPEQGRSVLHPEDADDVAAAYHRVIAYGESVQLDYRISGTDTGLRWLRTWLTAGTEDDPVVHGLVVDVTEQKALEAQLTRQALYDGLTGLPNRALLLDRAHQALHGLARGGGAVAVVFGDLALFKRVNDSLGHAAGDALLTAFGERLAELVRPTDTVARFGGDEFVVLAGLDHETEVAGLVERLLTAFEQPFAVDGRDLALGGRFGAVVTCDANDDPDRLLLAANAAMHHAKQAGGGWALYDPVMHDRERERAALEGDLADAVSLGQLRLRYQPIVRAGTRDLVAVEALLRWQHPERGLLGPGEFLDIAEATGQVLPIGRWVLAEACAQLAQWRGEGATDLVVNVNLSARQLGDADLVSSVLAALRGADVPPDRLCLEITETALIADPQTAADTLTELCGAGVRLALDDFGTGYSSLTHLRQFPVTTLKVDRSFAVDVLTSSSDRGIVRSIVGMAENLRLGVVAEGVETEEQAARLTTLGCGFLQGYLVSRPVPPDEVSPLLRPRTVTA